MFLLVNVYNHISFQNNTEAIVKLDIFLENTVCTLPVNCIVLIMGDFNIHPCPKLCPIAYEGEELNLVVDLHMEHTELGDSLNNLIHNYNLIPLQTSIAEFCRTLMGEMFNL